MSKIADTEANATSLDGLVNDNALVPTLRNGPKPSYQYLVDGWTGEIDALTGNFAQESTEAITEFNLTLDQYKESRGFNTKGTFAAGFTYELPNDVGLDADGNPWAVIDTSSLPVTVTAGTTPTNPPYKQVIYGTAAQVSTNTSDTVQSFVDSFSLKIFQSPTDGGLTEIQTRTVDAGEVYEVRKTSDDSLATIYSDAAGTVEIVQNGTSNVSGSDGVVEFFVADGDYYVEVGSVKSNFNTLTANYISLAVKDEITPNSVSVQDAIDWHGIFVEEFRESGDSDSEVITKSLQYISNLPYTGTKLIFERGREYIYDSTHYLYEINNLHIDLNGATLKRSNAALTSTLTSVDEVLSNNINFEVDDPSIFKVGDYVSFFNGNGYQDICYDARKITEINGNTLKLFSTIGFRDGRTTMLAGTTVAKKFTCFEGRPSSPSSGSPLSEGINSRIFITNGTIDGNRVNQNNYSWTHLSEILLHSKAGVIRDMEFKEIGGESIVGHGMSVNDNLFEYCNGSALHLSMNDNQAVNAGWTVFSNNTLKRTNQITNAINGHSEGAITFSWGAGNLVVSNNVCKYGQDSFLGGFDEVSAVNKDRLMIVTGNICDGYKSIMHGIYSGAEGVIISNNVFANCGIAALNNPIITSLIKNPMCFWGGNRLTAGTLSDYSDIIADKRLFIGTDIEKQSVNTAAYVQSDLVNYSFSLTNNMVKEGNRFVDAYVCNPGQDSGQSHYTAGGGKFGDILAHYRRSTEEYMHYDNTVNGGSVKFTFADSLGNRLELLPNNDTVTGQTSVGVFCGGIGTRRVEVGDADSAGTGYRSLRILN